MKLVQTHDVIVRINNRCWKVMNGLKSSFKLLFLHLENVIHKWLLAGHAQLISFGQFYFQQCSVQLLHLPVRKISSSGFLK